MKVRLGYSLLLIALPSACSHPQAIASHNTSPSDAPLVRLQVQGPFNATGFDGPDFVLYESGLAIFRAEDTAASMTSVPQYRFVRLSPAEGEGLARRIAFLLGPLDTDYAPPPYMSDPVLYTFYFRDADRVRRTTVLGGLWKSAPWREKLPTSLLAVYDTLSPFHDARSKPWQPPYLQVLLWPIDIDTMSAGCDSRSFTAWPSSWSTHIDSSEAGRYLMQLPISELPRFRKHQVEHGTDVCHPTLIGGRSWSFGYRFPFPAEELWKPN